MKIMSYNTLFGGFDGNDGRRFDAQMELINKVQPDILLAQELKGYTENGMKRLFKMEEHLKENIIGQDEAVSTVCRAIRRSRAERQGGDVDR